MPTRDEILQAASSRAVAFKSPKDLSPLVSRLARSNIVMLGEATHGTQEFYEWRRMLTEWLIVKHGFDFVAVEGDWPSCRAIHDYGIRGAGGNARDVLGAFHRWPTWMWANTEMIRFAEWLRAHNQRVPSSNRVGFYGLDVYSLFESMAAVVSRLKGINPFMARKAQVKYACFDSFHGDERAYARSLLAVPEGCESEVVEVLQELLSLRIDDADDLSADLFDAQQNARIAQNAEQYYRAMIHADDRSWNVRDRHMMETLELLRARYGREARGIVWAHNTHIGDYRATDMAKAGLVNIGGLAREIFGPEQVALVGFGTYEGSVIASHAWEGPLQKLLVPAAKHGTYEDILHQISLEKGSGRLWLDLNAPETNSAFSATLGHRAIGVVYDPEHERWSNYVPTSLARRYDAFLFFDDTTALEPLIQGFSPEELPETWPQGQ